MPEEDPTTGSKIDDFADLLKEASKHSRNTIFLLVALSIGLVGALLSPSDLDNIERRLEATEAVLKFLQGESQQIEGTGSSEGEWLYKFDHIFENEEDVALLAKELKASGRRILSTKQSAAGLLPSSIHRLNTILVASIAVIGMLLLLQLQLKREEAIICSAWSNAAGWTEEDSLYFRLNHVLLVAQQEPPRNDSASSSKPITHITHYWGWFHSLPQGAVALPAVVLGLCVWQTAIASNGSPIWLRLGIPFCWVISLLLTSSNLQTLDAIQRQLKYNNANASSDMKS